MSIIKTGNATHGANLLTYEQTRQAAVEVAGVTQAQLKTATISYYRSCLASAISATCRQASLRQEATSRRTPSSRMLPSVIGGPGACLGFTVIPTGRPRHSGMFGRPYPSALCCLSYSRQVLFLPFVSASPWWASPS
jgi:hypothetical protein